MSEPVTREMLIDDLTDICSRAPCPERTFHVGLALVLRSDERGCYPYQYDAAISRLGISLVRFTVFHQELVDHGVCWSDEDCRGYLRLCGLNERRFRERIARRLAIPREVRISVIQRSGGVCFYCKTPTDEFHIDHYCAWSRGGSNRPENLVASCPSCNLSKSSKTVDEWGWNG